MKTVNQKWLVEKPMENLRVLLMMKRWRQLKKLKIPVQLVSLKSLLRSEIVANEFIPIFFVCVKQFSDCFKKD